MSTAFKGRGTKIQRDTTPPTDVWTNITSAKDIQTPSPTVEEIDYTNQDSPSNSKEFLAGDVDYGEVTFQVNYQSADATHVLLLADALSGTARTYGVLFPSPASLRVVFTAFVKSAVRNAPVSGVQTMDVTLRVTGAPTEDTTP